MGPEYQNVEVTNEACSWSESEEYFKQYGCYHAQVNANPNSKASLSPMIFYERQAGKVNTNSTQKSTTLS